MVRLALFRGHRSSRRTSCSRGPGRIAVRGPVHTCWTDTSRPPPDQSDGSCLSEARAPLKSFTSESLFTQPRAVANRRWRWPFRCRGSRHESAVAFLVVDFRSMTPKCSLAGIGESRQQQRHIWAGLFVAILFVASWFSSGSQVDRALVAFIPVVALMLIAELTAESRQKLLSRERWRTHRAQISKGQSWRSVVLGLLNALIVSFAVLTLLQTRHPDSMRMGLVRLMAGVALLYGAAGFIFEVSALCFRMAGYSLPLMHRTPIAARSVREFWGQRWNIIVSAWLRTFVFQPLARRGFAGVGILSCFLVSGAFHGWPMLVALGPSAALSTVAFFAIHGVVVLIESRLSIHSWPVIMARLWTLVILLASAPLFIEPGLRLFGF